MANAKIKKREKGKGKNFYRNEMLTPEEIVYCSPTLSDQVFNNFIFYHVRSLSDVDECSEAHPFKMNKCHPNASCTNTQGSYNCSYNPTFIYVFPVAIPEIFAQTQGFDYWQLIHSRYDYI